MPQVSLPLLLQVNWVYDVSTSVYRQLQLLRGQDIEAGVEEGGTPAGKRAKMGTVRPHDPSSHSHMTFDSSSHSHMTFDPSSHSHMTFDHSSHSHMTFDSSS